MPERIQLRRTKGWRKPENTVVVSRPSRWGNPYKEGITPGNYASWFRADVLREMASAAPTEDHPWSRHLHFIAHNLRVLRGLNLACWCPLDQPCHADVLLELANHSQPNLLDHTSHDSSEVVIGGTVHGASDAA